MTLVAYPLSSPRVFPAAPSAIAARGFVELDDRVAAGTGGVVVVRAPSHETAEAMGAHVARRARASGMFAIEARAAQGAPLWREVASRLGVGTLASDPVEAADAIARAAALRRAVVVATLPARGTWDRAVACELTTLGTAPAVVLVATGVDGTEDLAVDLFEIGATLDDVERQRWWVGIADAANVDVTADALATLDAWWSNARHAPTSRSQGGAVLGAGAEKLAAMLALAGRAWPAEDLAFLGADDGAVAALAHAGAARAAGGWVVLEASWQARAEALAEASSPALAEVVAQALVTRFAHDPWGQSRAAELFVRVGASLAADEAHARALSGVDDSLARREIVSRWMAAVGTLPREAQLTLRVRATERALAIGEAEEAFRWAQSATSLSPQDPRLGLLFGRAAVALGDLVAAKVALERGAEHAVDDAARALICAELAEVAYLGGDLTGAAREAQRALALDDGAATRLKARNTLGKLLLAGSSWNEADLHFAEDAWTAAAAGLHTEELRARLNRGIALLSKGMVDEARAIFEAVLIEGERGGDARACAFALDNLSVVATLRHDYAQALALAERTLKLRQRIGDRVATARLLGNLAELRRRLGLLDHAEHAVAFGRRTLGPGMPPARSAHFSLQASRNALIRGSTVEARREATRALAEGEAAGMRNYVCEAYCVATRVALEDGDLARAGELLERARALATTDELRGEAAIVTARHARAYGDDGDGLALEALAAARASGKEDLVIEAHALLAEIHRAAGRVETARAHIESAVSLRDQVGATLPDDVRAAFLSRPDLLSLAKLYARLAEPVSQNDLAPSSQALPRPSVRSQASAPRELVGDDPAIRGLLSAVKKVAHANSTVLIRGESGTGKELVAEAIHRASDRAAGPLVTVNCAALVETLLLSELFGHEKGAFTGAIARRRGRFELAEGGTLFLDEIGDISARTQVALLRVLQERTFERVGGTTPIRANVRVICATHRDLKAMVERGEFREDLYYRLRGITLEVPPLRARMGDMPRISDHLLARIAVERGEPKKALAADALELLGRHRWAGNVRELENALRAASLFADGDVITASTLVDNVDDLRAAAQLVRSRATLPPPPLPASDELGVGEAAGADDDAEGEATVGPLPSSEASATAVAYSQVRGGATSLPDIKRQIERDCIARALAETKGNITRAAALLGMKRPRLSQLVKQYGLAAVSSEGS
ncbi:MAG TPA: sigma 54-interacting transcriptional regulator [Polyangiaceae bacterium]|jgi:transcriptional regulator with GAF, ATPase, and Fis domain/tetratricopeptide (TPR) repeat protein